MKKRLAIYLAMAMLFMTVSCVEDEDDVVLSPYAMMDSFGIGSISSEYPSFTAEGLDTFVTKTIDFSSRRFTIDQVAGEVYNVDSLPFATKVDKLLVNMQVTGYASIYVDSIGLYDYFSSTDSIDFSYPRKFRITSADSEYSRDYIVKVNVHQVEPELMVWEKQGAIDGISPLRALEFNGIMCLFGEKDGKWAVAKSELSGVPSWQQAFAEGLPSTANLATVQLFNGALYVVAADGLYTSTDAVNWSQCYNGNGLVAIVGASDVDGKMWLASADELFFTTDGVNLESAGSLPGGFPVYGVSIASYILSHHSGIVRYMLVGYTDEAMDGDVAVWSKLSTEEGWARYENSDNPYACPALKGLSVVRYDNCLYALGGAGAVNGVDVDAFSSFYISRDNGITWKTPADYYQRMPAALNGKDAPFAVAVDSNNMMWIISGGEEGAVWKGIINRLGFKN